MRAWRVVSGVYGVVVGGFAIWAARLASNLFLLSAEIRRMIGRTVPEDDPADAARWYLAASLVLASIAGALLLHAAVGRPAPRSDDVLGERPVER